MAKTEENVKKPELVEVELGEDDLERLLSKYSVILKGRDGVDLKLKLDAKAREFADDLESTAEDEVNDLDDDTEVPEDDDDEEDEDLDEEVEDEEPPEKE